MKKLRRYGMPIAFVCSLILLVGYLFFSTAIFDKLIETENSFKEISESAFAELEGDDYVFIEWASEPQVLTDFYQSLHLNSIVFCENEEYSADKEYGVILKSDDTIYLAKAQAGNGKTAMNGKISQGYKLASDNILLNVKIPTITLKNGKYDLYIRDYESGDINGLCHTGITFVKSDTGFEQYWGSKEENLLAEYANVNLALDAVEDIDGNTLSISGWATYEAVNPVEQAVYVEIYNDPFAEPVATYQSAMLRRSGLGDYFGDPVYDYCGFQLHAEKPADLADLFYVRLVLTEGGEYYRSTLRIAYQNNEGTYELVQWRNTADDHVGDVSTLPGNEPAAPAEETESLYSEERTEFYFSYLDDQVDEKLEELPAEVKVDSLAVEGTALVVSGHVEGMPAEYESSTVIMHVQCKDRTRRAYQVVLDPAAKAADGTLPFVFRVPAEYMPENMEWSMFIDNGTLYHKNDYVAQWPAGGQPQLMNALVQAIQPSSDKALAFSVDALSLNEGVLNVIGWVYATDMDASAQKVYLAFYNDLAGEPLMTAETSQQHRPGLADALGLDASYDYAGFTTTFHTADLRNTGVWYIRFILDNGTEGCISDRAVKVDNGTITEYVAVQK